MNTGLKMLVAAAVLATAAAMAPGAATAGSPLGFKVFCLKHADECRASSSAKVELSDAEMSILKKVNLAVNNAIRPSREKRGKDTWVLDARAGDCEDYVVTKRSRLIKLGIPAGALRIAHVRTRRGVDHAILIVRTNQGDLVLDNLTNAIKPISQTGHRILSMSGANPRNWTSA